MVVEKQKKEKVTSACWDDRVFRTTIHVHRELASYFEKKLSGLLLCIVHFFCFFVVISHLRLAYGKFIYNYIYECESMFWCEVPLKSVPYCFMYMVVCFDHTYSM